MPVLRELKVENLGDDVLNDLSVEIEADPPVLLARRWPIDRIAGHSTTEVRDLDVSLNAGLMLGLQEAMTANVTVRVSQGGTELARCSYPLEALAQTEWGGAAMPELLAAFVMPNDPAVDTVLKAAAQVLTRAGKSDRLEWLRIRICQSGVGNGVGDLVGCGCPRHYLRTAAGKLRDAGAEDKAPLDHPGERAWHLPRHGLLFAAALEQAGLNPIWWF